METCHQLYNVTIHQCGILDLTVFQSSVFITDQLIVQLDLPYNTKFTATAEAISLSGQLLATHNIMFSKRYSSYTASEHPSIVCAVTSGYLIILCIT